MARKESIIRFGTDGWHARFDKDFTEENVVRLAEALGMVWAEQAGHGRIYVGYDTRYNAKENARAAAATLAACGLDVVVSQEVCPTPGIACACAHDAQAIGALIITASKRSCEYGGILVRGSDGSECSRGFLEAVEEAVPSMPRGKRASFSEADLVGPYLEALLKGADAETIGRAHLKVVVDPMYGSGRNYLADLLRGAGCEVVEIHNEPFADFGNIHPEPINPWADGCEQAVRETGAHLGLLLDGDGDRSALVDDTGRLLSPQQQVALVLKQLVEGRNMTGRVVSTLSTSSLISKQAQELGLSTKAVPVGFPRLYREMCEGDVLMVAEEYGGIGVPSHLLERDGLFACLLLVELVARTQNKPSELCKELEQKLGRMCYARRDVRLEFAAIQTLRIVLPGLNPAFVAGKEPIEVSHADGLRLDFANGSWVLVRPSRTDSVVRIYSEAPTEQERDAILQDVSNIIKAGL